MNVECCARHKNLNENIGARNHMTPHMTYQPHYTRDTGLQASRSRNWSGFQAVIY